MIKLIPSEGLNFLQPVMKYTSSTLRKLKEIAKQSGMFHTLEMKTLKTSFILQSKSFIDITDLTLYETLTKYVIKMGLYVYSSVN
jgi:hypothetical protein